MGSVRTDGDTRGLFRQIGGRIDRRAGGHLYRQVGRLIEQTIRGGQLRPGDLLPPQRELSQILRISEVTIRRALQDLANRGLLEARPGSGTVVLAGTPGPAGVGEPRRVLSIGIAFTNLTDGYPFFGPLLEGVRRDAPQPVSVRLFDTPPLENSSPAFAPPASLEPRDSLPSLDGLDGLILMSPVNLSLLTMAQERRLPVVLLYSDIHDGYSRCLLVDHARGVHQAVRHLLERGKRRLALVTADASRFSTGRWVEAFTTALETHNLELRPDWILHAGYHEQDGYRAAGQLLRQHPRPDAVLMASDHQARGGLIAAHELGLNVPDDLAIIGAGRVLDPAGWPVPLTTIDLHFDQLGQHARQIIEQWAAGRHDLPYRTAIASSLIVGQTS